MSTSFLHFRNASSNDGASNRLSLFGRGTSAGTDTGSDLAAPFDVTMLEGSIVAPTAPGAGKKYQRQLKINGILTGPLVSLDDAATSVRTSLSSTLITSPVVHLLNPTQVGGPAVVILNDVYRYSCSDPTISLNAAGDESSNLTLAGTDRFLGFEGNGVAEGTATESVVQVNWPATGMFKFMGARIGVGAATTANVFLRINGVDTLLGIVGASGAAIATYTDLTHTVAVTAGDLVNFVFRRTSGATASISIGLIVGFIGLS